MNKLDLKSYKDNDTAIYSLIPGIHNLQSVGSVPRNRMLASSINSTNGAMTSVLQSPGTKDGTLISGRYDTTGSIRTLSRGSSTGALLKQVALYDQHPIKESIHYKSKLIFF